MKGKTKAKVQKLKTIMVATLGDGLQTIDQLLVALKKAGCTVEESVRAMFALPQIVMTKDRQDVKLVEITMRQIGFSEAASYQEFLRRLKRHGLRACHPECGPRVCLGIMFSTGLTLTIATDLVTVDGRYYYFTAHKRGADPIRFRANVGGPSVLHGPETRWVVEVL